MPLCIQGQHIEGLGDQADQQDPQQVAGDAAGAVEADDHAPDIDRKGNPPEDAHFTEVVEKHLAAVIDKHEEQGDQLQQAGGEIPGGSRAHGRGNVPGTYGHRHLLLCATCRVSYRDPAAGPAAMIPCEVFSFRNPVLSRKAFSSGAFVV